MIDERELLEWLESAKTIAKIPAILPDGKYTAVVEIVPLLGKIREMRGGADDGKETEIGQQDL